METINQPEPIIMLADDSLGIYIPKHFAETAADHWEGFDPEDRELLKEGPDHEHYWDRWADVLDNAELTTEAGVTYHLHQDGDLWAVCDDMLNNEDYADFYGEERI